MIVPEPKKKQDVALGRIALVVWGAPDREDHEARRRWAGRRFDPESANVHDTNKAAASPRKCKDVYRFWFERGAAQIGHAQIRPSDPQSHMLAWRIPCIIYEVLIGRPALTLGDWAAGIP